MAQVKHELQPAIYDHLNRHSPDSKNNIIYNFYHSVFQNMLLQIFTINNAPDSIDVPYTLRYAFKGQVAFYKDRNDQLISSFFELAGGNLDVYGRMTDIYAHTLNGELYKFNNFKTNDKVVACWLQDNREPVYIDELYSHYMAEVDKSIEILIVLTRMTKIPIVKSDKQRIALVNAIKDIQRGVPATFVSSKFDSSIAELTDDDNQFFEITDPDGIKALELLSHYKDDCKRWFLNYIGLNTQGASKMAQQSVDEINQEESSSKILIDMWERNLSKAIEECNLKFGTQMELIRNPLFKSVPHGTFLEKESEEEVIENFKGDEEPSGDVEAFNDDTVSK